MKVKIAELKNQLSAHLRRVEKGAQIIVTDRDRPIARIVPFEAKTQPITIRAAKRPFTSIRGRRYPSARMKISSTELLAQERGDR